MKKGKVKFMILDMDYQIIVNLCGQTLFYALPIGMIFAITERIGNMVISAVGGEKRLKL